VLRTKAHALSHVGSCGHIHVDTHAQKHTGTARAPHAQAAAAQAPVHAWRQEWEARKRRMALNGPAAQRARKLKAQLAKEHKSLEEGGSRCGGRRVLVAVKGCCLFIGEAS